MEQRNLNWPTDGLFRCWGVGLALVTMFSFCGIWGALLMFRSRVAGVGHLMFVHKIVCAAIVRNC